MFKPGDTVRATRDVRDPRSFFGRTKVMKGMVGVVTRVSFLGGSADVRFDHIGQVEGVSTGSLEKVKEHALR